MDPVSIASVEEAIQVIAFVFSLRCNLDDFLVATPLCAYLCSDLCTFLCYHSVSGVRNQTINLLALEFDWSQMVDKFSIPLILFGHLDDLVVHSLLVHGHVFALNHSHGVDERG